MNETPGYQPAKPLKVISHAPPSDGEYAEPPLVADVRKSTLEALLSCDILVGEIAEYAQQTGTTTERFARSLETIRESSREISEAVGDLRWVYPDGTPPRGWDPYNLNNQELRHDRADMT